MNKILVVVILLTLLSLGFFFIPKGGNRDQHLHEFQNAFNSGNLDLVIEKANLVLDKDKNNVDALIALAATYAMKGSIGFSEESHGAKAVEYADRVLAIDPKNSEAYRIKGYSFEIQELYDQAHINYDKAIEFNPKNFQALSNKGHSYDLQGDLLKAEEYYKKSLEVTPNSEHGLLNISRLFFRQNKFDDAKEHISRITTTSQNSRFKAEGYQLLAEIYRNEKKYDLAKDAIENSINQDPKVPQAWVSRGRIKMMTIFEVSQDKDQFIKEVSDYANNALSLNPNQATAYLLLSDLMVIAADPVKRQEYKDKAFNAIDADITLGQYEKKAMRSYLTADVKITKDSENPS